MLIAALWVIFDPITVPSTTAAITSSWLSADYIRRPLPTISCSPSFAPSSSLRSFQNLAAQVIAIFGVALGAMLLTIVGQLLWLGGLVYCAFGFLRDRLGVLLSVAAVIALPSQLFPLWVRRTDPDLTAVRGGVSAAGVGLPRILPHGSSLGFLIIALAIHPIMAVAGVRVVLIYLAQERPVWWGW